MAFRTTETDALRERAYIRSALFGTSGGTMSFWTRADGVGVIQALQLNSDQTATFANTIQSSLGSNTLLFNSSSATTGYQYFNIQNTSSQLNFGIEGTSAGTFCTGSLPYASLFGNTANNPVQLFTNNIARINISAAGVVAIPNLSASQAVFTDASKNLVSNAISGSGSVAMTVSPTFTGTVTATTMTAGDNSTKVASTAFVTTAMTFVPLQTSSPTTTQTVTANGSNTLVITPAGTIAALTIIFPSSPVNGQTFNIAISQIITALTLNAGSNTIDGTIVTTATNSSGGWVYVVGTTTWYKWH